MEKDPSGSPWQKKKKKGYAVTCDRGTRGGKERDHLLGKSPRTGRKEGDDARNRTRRDSGRRNDGGLRQVLGDYHHQIGQEKIPSMCRADRTGMNGFAKGKRVPAKEEA